MLHQVMVQHVDNLALNIDYILLWEYYVFCLF